MLLYKFPITLLIQPKAQSRKLFTRKLQKSLSLRARKTLFEWKLGKRRGRERERKKKRRQRKRTLRMKRKGKQRRRRAIEEPWV